MAVLFCLRVGVVHGEWVAEEDIAREQERLAAKKIRYLRLLQDKVNKIGREMLEHLQMPSSSVAFYVIEGEQVGAWTYGDVVWTTTATVRFVQSDHELAALIGHELAHVMLGHGKEKAARTQEVIDLAVLLLAENDWLDFDVASLLAVAALARFEQEQEREADVVGMTYSYLIGYDPEAWPVMWERMAVELPGNLTTNLFSTHPAFPERVVIARRVAGRLRTQGAQKGKAPRPRRSEDAPFDASQPDDLLDPRKRPHRKRVPGGWLQEIKPSR